MADHFALHETLELHEIAAFKTTCLTKSKTMRALVSDEGLKQILQQDIEIGSRQLEELSSLLSRANTQGVAQ
ncbi:Spore coat protein F precursor [compost metagenome]